VRAGILDVEVIDSNVSIDVVVMFFEDLVLKLSSQDGCAYSDSFIGVDLVRKLLGEEVFKQFLDAWNS